MMQKWKRPAELLSDAKITMPVGEAEGKGTGRLKSMTQIQEPGGRSMSQENQDREIALEQIRLAKYGLQGTLYGTFAALTAIVIIAIANSNRTKRCTGMGFHSNGNYNCRCRRLLWRFHF
jgi:hypothetical protein